MRIYIIISVIFGALTIMGLNNLKDHMQDLSADHSAKIELATLGG